MQHPTPTLPEYFARTHTETVRKITRLSNISAELSADLFWANLKFTASFLRVRERPARRIPRNVVEMLRTQPQVAA